MLGKYTTLTSEVKSFRNFEEIIRGHFEEKVSDIPGKTTIIDQSIPYRVANEKYLPGQKLPNLAKKVSEHLLLNRSYLKKGCTCPEIAAEMRMQPYLLSAVINQVYNTNFNDFLNSYRVDFARELIQNGEAMKFTLEGLSQLCGFNNRNSFTTAFKKHFGITPSEFRKTSSILPLLNFI